MHADRPSRPQETTEHVLFNVRALGTRQLACARDDLFDRLSLRTCSPKLRP